MTSIHPIWTARKITSPLFISFQVHLYNVERDERSKIVKLTEKHCKQASQDGSELVRFGSARAIWHNKMGDDAQFTNRETDREDAMRPRKRLKRAPFILSKL